MPIYHDGCNHYACARTCTDGTSNVCPVCTEKRAGGEAHDDVEQMEVVMEARQVKPKKERWGAGLFALANNLSASLRNRNETIETSQDPFWLITQHAPVKTLMGKKLGLPELIESGVTMDNFLKAGYNIKELAFFPEFSPKIGEFDVHPMGVNALLALKMTPSHLRDYRNLLPIGEVRKKTGLTDRHIVENFKIGFHPVLGIVSSGNDRKWTIGDLRYLGFLTMEDFIRKLGLRYVDHWDALNPTRVEVNEMRVTREQINNLERRVVNNNNNNNASLYPKVASRSSGTRVTAPVYGDETEKHESEEVEGKPVVRYKTKIMLDGSVVREPVDTNKGGRRKVPYDLLRM